MRLLEDVFRVKVDILDVVDQQLDDLRVLSEDVSDEEAILDDAVIVLHKIFRDLEELQFNLGVQLSVAVLCRVGVLKMNDQLVTEPRQALEVGDEVDLAREVVSLEAGEEASKDELTHVGFFFSLELDDQVVCTVCVCKLLHLLIVARHSGEDTGSLLPKFLVLVSDDHIEEGSHATHATEVDIVL